MTVPKYLATFRRAVRELERPEEGEINEKSSTLNSLYSLISHPPASKAGAIAGRAVIRLSPAPKAWTREKSEISEKTKASPFGYAEALDRLERRCPDYLELDQWQRCVEDAKRFLAGWGDRAAALGWTADELFGLHTPPAKPHPSYSRLSRYDATGLLWFLEGRAVVVLTQDTAAIRMQSGAVLTYRRHTKPALGPIGDSLDDLTT